MKRLTYTIFCVILVLLSITKPLLAKRTAFDLPPPQSSYQVLIQSYWQKAWATLDSATDKEKNANAKKEKEQPTQTTKVQKSKDLVLFNDKFFENDKIIVSRAYPNPATTVAVLEYVIYDYNINAKITISNVLGNIMQEYSLSPEQKRLKINTADLNSGVYFYALSIDGKSVAAKKLIVRGM